MRILYQFPLSHYCEKARWLLDHKELDFVAQNLIPGVHRAFAQLKTGQNKLPILKDSERWIADSTEIALYLDDTYPEHALLRLDPHLRQQALEINTLSNELGAHVRRWGLAQALSTSDEPLGVFTFTCYFKNPQNLNKESKKDRLPVSFFFSFFLIA